MKDGNNVSGGGRLTCPFYEELDAILGHRAASCPPIIVDSGEPQESETSCDNSPSQNQGTVYYIVLLINYAP